MATRRVIEKVDEENVDKDVSEPEVTEPEVVAEKKYRCTACGAPHHFIKEI